MRGTEVLELRLCLVQSSLLLHVTFPCGLYYCTEQELKKQQRKRHQKRGPGWFVLDVRSYKARLLGEAVICGF